MRSLGTRAREVMGTVAANCQRYDVPVSLEAIFLSAIETYDSSHEILREAQLQDLFAGLRGVTTPDAQIEISPWFEGLTREDFATPYISLQDVIVSLATRIGERLDNLLVTTGSTNVAAILQRVEETTGNVADGPLPIEPQSSLRYAVVISGPGFVHDSNRYDRIEVAEAAKHYFEGLLLGANLDNAGATISFGFHLPSTFYHATQIVIRELG
jgi:hypothetical protein